MTDIIFNKKVEFGKEGDYLIAGLELKILKSTLDKIGFNLADYKKKLINVVYRDNDAYAILQVCCLSKYLDKIKEYFEEFENELIVFVKEKYNRKLSIIDNTINKPADIVDELVIKRVETDFKLKMRLGSKNEA